ncbi:MAG: hypothetical protein PSX81_00330 [bacterium]|nr:hypothetical protein [bacterium]
MRKWIYDTAGIIPKDFSYCDYPSDNFTCYYDKKGRKIKEVYGSDAVQNGKTFENTYIEGGRKHIISEFDNSPRKLVSKYINIFDSSQNMISSQLFYGKDSKAANLVIFDYDSHSNLIRRRVFINDTILRNTDSFIYDNAGHKLRHFFIGKNMNVLTAYDENGNTTIADNRFYEFENFRRCPPLGKGLAHVLKVEIPYSGNWEFNVTTTNFNNVIAISDANNEHNYKKMMDSNPVIFENKLVIELNQGIYYFVIAGKEINDAGVYKLVIKRVN